MCSEFFGAKNSTTNYLAIDWSRARNKLAASSVLELISHVSPLDVLVVTKKKNHLFHSFEEPHLFRIIVRVQILLEEKT